MKAGAASVIVFAALDGHFLSGGDAHVAELRAAAAALERAGVPVIAWSGGTRAEIEVLREQMDIRAPFVTEGGAALFVPAGYFQFPLPATRTVPGYEVIEFGVPYERLVATLRRVATALQVDVVMLADMAIEEVAEDFRLPLLDARLVKLREYGELFRVVDDRRASRARLFRALRAAGLTCREGDRYDLLMGVGSSTVALQTAQRLLQRARGHIVTIGIGSRPADLPVLEQADVRIVIRHEDPSVTAHVLNQIPGAHVIEQVGVGGWVEVITRVRSRACRLEQ